ncbi:MAG: PKD-like family lipoprotein [Chitinophagaceae bacterium]
MKLRFYQYIIPVCLLLALSACYRDLGNYDYKQPNTVTIGGINDKYIVMQGTYFELVPQLAFSDSTAKDSARYTYQWISMKSGALPADKRLYLGTGRSLRTNMAMAAGVYTVYYLIKDTLTGLQFQKSFTVEVQSNIYEGWMVMTDVNGIAKLAMISKLNNQYTVIPDVLASTGSALALQGKPLAVNCMRINALSTGYAIYISTDKTTDRIDAETFQYNSTLNIKYEMLSNIPETFAPAAFANAGGYRIFMLEGTDVYFYYYTYQIRFGLPVNIMKNEALTFHTAPFIAASTLAEVTVLYDNDNKRFVRHSGNDASCTLMPDGTLFDYKTGKDLVYMTFSAFNNGNVFAILRDAAANKYYLARFLLNNNIQQVYYDEMTATDIAQAKNFAVSPDLGYIFYTVNNKLYSYDMSLKASKLMMDRGTQSFTALSFYGSILMAGVVDPAKPEGANGILESYTVPPVQGALVLGNKWEGLGKVVSFSYRNR